MSADRAVVALEIGPMGERHHTGIANVTRNLARQMLGDEKVEPRFFFNRGEIAVPLVRQLLYLDGGDILWWLAGRVAGSPNFDFRKGAIGIYPGHKSHRRQFPTEVQIVHDLTTLVTPHFHTEDAVTFWQEQMLGDLLSSDLIVAVSQSTRMDLLTYYPQLADTPLVVAPLASTLAPASVGRQATEPYVLVLGTLEPRKNVETVFELLASDTSLLEGCRFVFAGRWGWGDEADELIERYGLANAVGQGRILFTGFIGDAGRDLLLRHARAVLYVSHYEGFGLPVLEALAEGVPVITGQGSSLPEAGGEGAIYCDVGSAAAIGEALRRAHGLDDAHKTAAQEFTWTRTWHIIRDAALDVAKA